MCIYVYYILLPNIQYTECASDSRYGAAERKKITTNIIAPRYLYKITMLSNFAINIKRWYKYKAEEEAEKKTRREIDKTWVSATYPSVLWHYCEIFNSMYISVEAISYTRHVLQSIKLKINPGTRWNHFELSKGKRKAGQKVPDELRLNLLAIVQFSTHNSNTITLIYLNPSNKIRIERRAKNVIEMETRFRHKVFRFRPEI